MAACEAKAAIRASSSRVKTPPPLLFRTWMTPSSFPPWASRGAQRMERVRKSVSRSVSGLKRASL
jgi:hypothetical protein